MLHIINWISLFTELQRVQKLEEDRNEILRTAHEYSIALLRSNLSGFI